MKTETNIKYNTNDIAIIGLSGRFPGAEDINAFWDIIKDGKETISYYTKEELLEKGVNAELLKNPDYVFAGGKIDSADKFDSSFFGYTPREADFMDPQHRVFLEESYSALENAGYDPERFDGDIGVFAGCSSNRYLLKNLSPHVEVLNSLGELQTIVNNDKDFLTTRVSYKLNLTGPSVNVQTACSSSLVAIHFACQSLITNQCDMALAGGVFVMIPHGEGYIFQEGSIDSPSGHCRPFNKDSDGTIFSEGAGVVVVRRLEDAVRDHDNILAVIKATAVNNDGSMKVGFMAPGVSGQVRVISKALKVAGIDPETISYIETHGTGTKLGDPIEIEALRRAFLTPSGRTHYCALGSVKANIGHLDAAAGVTGLIKAALALKNQQLPPLVNFTYPNPELDIERSPFYINRELKNWVDGASPRRAAISSFGIGGTNSHAILEEWIPDVSIASLRRFLLLPISAKSELALQGMYNNLTEHLGTTSDNIDDIAFTLQIGRKEFGHRGLFIYDKSDINNSETFDLSYYNGLQKLVKPKTVFMFTGQGSQYINMARGLYEQFDSVKTIIDYGNTLLIENINLNLLDIIFNDNESNKKLINNTSIAQPALFVLQFAIANLLIEFGVIPQILIGHSIGEITAACLSGVFSFEDAIKVVAWRGKLMQEQVPGSMLSINLSKDQVIPLLSDEVELALHNAPNFCVVSGSFDAIAQFEKKLYNIFPNCRATRLKTSHAFHSKFMEPAVASFLKVMEEIEFNRLNIPFLSNVTGTWITEEEALSPNYWASHIRSMVNFNDGVVELIQDQNSIFIEIGPGSSLSMFLSQFPVDKSLISVSTLRHPNLSTNDVTFFFKSVADYWLKGGIINWEHFYEEEKRFRVPLPTYPFEKRTHWVNPLVQRSDKNILMGERSGYQSSGATKPDVNGTSTESSDFYHERPSLVNDFIAADSDIEKSIAAIWEKLLGIKNIGVTDNFFLIGGHSLLAAQIINKINEEFKSSITIGTFFNFPTIRGLVENASFEHKVGASEQVLSNVDQTGALLLSPSQERFWTIEQIDNNTANNISFSFLFEGSLNTELFVKSLEELFERHKVLKSYFRVENGTPVAYIDKDSGINISLIDFSGIPSSDLEDKLQEFMENASKTKFIIEHGPLYKFSLLNIGNGKSLFHLTIHHLIFDGWSWGIFTRELKEIYNSLISGTKTELDPLPLNYFEYAQLARQEDPNVKYEELKEFWKKKLAGISGKLNFPLDFKRKEISTGSGGRVDLNLGEERSEKIKEYCNKENVTLYMFFLSLFGFLLSRYSGDDDICIGSPTANRPSSNLEKLIGLFINSIVLRLQFNEELKFSDLLQKVKNVAIDAISHQDLPIENLVDLLQPERVLNMNPIFQVMFAWQNAPRPPLDLMGIRSERVFQKNGVSPLDMTFYAWEENDSVIGEIEFSTDIFKRSTIEAFKENFIYLVDQIIKYPEIFLKDVPIISDKEKERLAEFNRTETFVPDVLVQNLFEQQVNLFADKIAVESVTGGGNLNYSELNERANQLAQYLQGRKFKEGCIAGISMTRSESMLVAVLGVLKAGGTYLPLDPAFPDDRLLYMIEDSGATFLITEDMFKHRFIESNTNVIVYDAEQITISKESSNPVHINVDVNSIAYIIYTSGSTGKPKGVKVHHKALVNFITSMSKRPGLTPEDKLLAVTTLSFDISGLEMFLPISQGATVYIADNEHINDGEGLSRIISEYNISIMQATPVTWTILLASGWQGNKKLKALCGGEAVQPSLVRDLINKVDSVWNMYGPTETTIWSSCELLTDYNQILIGKPIANTKFYILYHKQEQPIGACGELCIGGMGVSKGYHNREELNKEKFVLWNDEVIYRTGDLARFLDDGRVELFGRTDNQIKLRGFRIEPGEIEFQLSQLEGVKEAIVKLEKLAENDERLVGYLKVDDSFIFSREAVVKSIDTKLPNYMIPYSFMTMKEFPRTLNGKVDRKALIFKFNDLPGVPDRVSLDIKTLNPTEKRIFDIWCDILKTNDILITDNFFEIGGNSLLAISVMAQINSNFNSSLGLRVFFDSPRIIDLAEAIDIVVQKTLINDTAGRINGNSIKVVKGEI